MRDAGGRYRARGFLHAQGALARAVEHRREAQNRAGGAVAASVGGRVVAGLSFWWSTTRRYQSRFAAAVDEGADSPRHSAAGVDAQLETRAAQGRVSDHRDVAGISHR